MKFRMIGRSAVVLAFGVAPGLLFAEGIPTPPNDDVTGLPSCEGTVEFDGRYYELRAAKGITWAQAKAAAETSQFEGVDGHLATITSAAEDDFVESLRQCAKNRRSNPLIRQEVWVGGIQDTCDAQPGCGWRWVNDEGPVSTPSFPLPSYSNWLEGEPNNLGGNERHLGIGLGDAFGWNDEGDLNNIGGYIIEYDTSSNISVIQCTDEDGCQTTTGQTLRLPPGVNPDGSIGVRTYEFTDPRAISLEEGERCGERGLTLFTERGPDQELRIPAYLCGSPKFLVVEVQTDDVQIVQGTVLVENEPILALPGNWYECDGLVNPQPAPPAPLSGADPQGRDVVAWQTTNPANMREDGFLTGIPQSFVGALGEFTFECGSSRGLTRTASYFVIGLHINFGLDFSTQQEAVSDQFVALTRYKLELLRASVDASGPTVSNVALLQAHLTNAIRFHDRGQYASALTSINLFLEKVEQVIYAPTADNFSGEHLSRGRNIAFMYEEKVIPFTP